MIESAETFTQIEEPLQGAEVNFVVIDGVWNDRQVTSSNHPGNIELLVLSKRFNQQFQQKRYPFEESKALKSLCERVANWYDETDPQAVMYVTGISDLGALATMFEKMESEFEVLNEEEAIQLLVKEASLMRKNCQCFSKIKKYMRMRRFMSATTLKDEAASK